MSPVKLNVAAALVVRKEAGAWIAELAFTNVGAAPAPLFEHNLPNDGALQNDVFRVLTPMGFADYLGLSAKRPAPEPHELVWLEPRATLKRWARLDAYYRIPAERPRGVLYQAVHGDPSGELFAVRSGIVDF